MAEFYIADFLKGYETLNLTWPEEKKFCKATEHISEQIELVKKIEAKGFAYKTGDGIYFNVKAFEKAGNQYGQLSTLDQIKVGTRAEVSKEKKDERDFALWKFSPWIRSERPGKWSGKVRGEWVFLAGILNVVQ